MTLLLLGGTGDGKRIATRLVEQGVDLTISLAGATRNPDAMPASTRVGGFGGAEGFEAYLDEAGISAVLDATHPYAHRITDRTAAICKARNMHHAIFHRPPWEPKEGDRWIEIEHEEEDGEKWTQKIAFQYMGCYWHFCRWQCQKSRATIEDAIKDHKILEKLINRYPATGPYMGRVG